MKAGKAVQQAAKVAAGLGKEALIAREVASGSAAWRAAVGAYDFVFCKALRLACFEAGTPIQAGHGPVPVEQVKAGDRVWARSEFDPEGSVELKVVEEVFDRHAQVLRLRLPGGVAVGTTFEHPFYVHGRGWVPAGELRAGDALAGRAGERVVVEGIEDTGEWKPVYNFRVADYHTYFVGAADWGYTLWAHNASYYNAAYRVHTVEEVATLRTAFNATEKVAFVKQWASSAQAKRLLTPAELAFAARKGVLPDRLVVHHIVPIYRGGTNAASNLRVMTHDFHHRFREQLHNYPIGANPYGRI